MKYKVLTKNLDWNNIHPGDVVRIGEDSYQITLTTGGTLKCMCEHPFNLKTILKLHPDWFSEIKEEEPEPEFFPHMTKNDIDFVNETCKNARKFADFWDMQMAFANEVKVSPKEEPKEFTRQDMDNAYYAGVSRVKSAGVKYKTVPFEYWFNDYVRNK